MRARALDAPFKLAGNEFFSASSDRQMESDLRSLAIEHLTLSKENTLFKFPGEKKQTH